MKAIITKYLPATNARGSRIKATAEGVKSLSIPYPYELSGEAVHKAAAIELCKRQEWPESLVGGGLPDQSGYAFCFNEPQVNARLIAAAPELLAALHTIHANAAESAEWIRRHTSEAIAKAQA